jgi:hypothetical protein
MEYNDRSRTVLRDLAVVGILAGIAIYAISASIVSGELADPDGFNEARVGGATIWQFAGIGVLGFGLASLVGWLVATSVNYNLAYHLKKDEPQS